MFEFTIYCVVGNGYLLAELFLFDGKTTYFKAHCKLVYNENKNDYNVNKVDRSLKTETVSNMVCKVREETEDDKDYCKENPEKGVFNTDGGFSDKAHNV